MGYFSNKLEELLTGRLQQDVAAAAGIGRSTLSQYVSGSRAIGVEALEQLLRAFPRQTERDQLVTAHLMDEIPPSEFGRIAIEIRGDCVNEPRADYSTDNEKAIRAAADLLIQRSKNNEDVARLLLDLERVLR